VGAWERGSVGAWERGSVGAWERGRHGLESPRDDAGRASRLRLVGTYRTKRKPLGSDPRGL